MGPGGYNHAHTHIRTAILLWPMMRWQTEPLQSIDINSGEESCLKSMEDPMLELTKKPMTQGSPHWRDPSLGKLQTTEGTRISWKGLWKTVSCVRDTILLQGRAVRSFPPEEQKVAEQHRMD